MSRPVLQVIAGSTRPGRKGIAVAQWVARQAEAHGGFDVELVDLADAGLPVLDEPNHPRLGQYTQQHTKDWSATISRADAFVFVFPEYNHSIPGGFKNAVDSLGPEWQGKTVAFVSYGADNGVRAVEHWRQIVANFHMVGVRQQVSLSRFREFGDDGLALLDRRDGELDTLFDQLESMAATLAA